MALLYPWATKEYLLWKMTIGQIIFYHNEGLRQKFPKPEDSEKTASGFTREQAKAIRDDCKAKYGAV